MRLRGRNSPTSHDLESRRYQRRDCIAGAVRGGAAAPAQARALRLLLEQLSVYPQRCDHGYTVNVDGEKVVVNFPVEDSPSIGPFASRSLPPQASGGPVPCPLGDFATGVECE